MVVLPLLLVLLVLVLVLLLLPLLSSPHTTKRRQVKKGKEQGRAETGAG